MFVPEGTNSNYFCLQQYQEWLISFWPKVESDELCNFPYMPLQFSFLSDYTESLKLITVVDNIILSAIIHYLYLKSSPIGVDEDM